MSGQRDLTRSRMAEAALNNESLTRQRVEWLEVLFKQYTADVKNLDDIQHTCVAEIRDLQQRMAFTLPNRVGFWRRGFLGRMFWLLTGR